MSPVMLNPNRFGGAVNPLKTTLLSFSPLGLWMCDEASGPTLFDSSGNGWDLTLTGAPTAFQQQTSGNLKGISWPATSTDYASSSTTKTLSGGNFTVITWVYITAAPVGALLNVAALDGASKGIRLQINTTRVPRYSITNSGTTAVNGNSGIALNAWHMVVGVSVSNVGHLWTDGVASATSGKTVPSATALNPYIHHSPLSATAIAGIIGPVAVFDGALSDSDFSTIQAAA